MKVKTRKLFDNCENFFGPLSPEIRKRIDTYLSSPTEENWDDIAGLIIRPEGMSVTIWEAWRRIDPKAPQRGRSWLYEKDDLSDPGVMTPWEKWPHPFVLRRAIIEATKETP